MSLPVRNPEATGLGHVVIGQTFGLPFLATTTTTPVQQTKG